MWIGKLRFFSYGLDKHGQIQDQLQCELFLFLSKILSNLIYNLRIIAPILSL